MLANWRQPSLSRRIASFPASFLFQNLVPDAQNLSRPLFPKEPRRVPTSPSRIRRALRPQPGPLPLPLRRPNRCAASLARSASAWQPKPIGRPRQVRAEHGEPGPSPRAKAAASRAAARSPDQVTHLYLD